MRNVLFAGILGGLAAGFLIGLLLSAIVPTDAGLPDHSLMALLAGALGAKHLAPAWMVTLGVGALLGAVFGGLARHARGGSVASAALLVAFVLWAIVATIGVPTLLGTRPVVGLMGMRAWPLVVGTLMLTLLFWSILTAVFLWCRGRARRVGVTRVRELPRAA